MTDTQVMKSAAVILLAVTMAWSEDKVNKVTDKRSILDLEWAGLGWTPPSHLPPLGHVPPAIFAHSPITTVVSAPWKPPVVWAPGASVSPWAPAGPWAPPSAAEVAAAVSAAREASAQVALAQRDVLAAREEVLAQQRVASAKEMQAADAIQRSEAQVAGARASASAAAHAVVVAQQRVAAAKARVAFAQRAAAGRESAAATAIQKHASAAADEIRRTDLHSAKLSAIHSSDAAAAAKYVTATKDATLVPLGATLVPLAPSHQSSHGANVAVAPTSSWDAFLKPVEFGPWG